MVDTGKKVSLRALHHLHLLGVKGDIRVKEIGKRRERLEEDRHSGARSWTGLKTGYGCLFEKGFGSCRAVEQNVFGSIESLNVFG